LSACRCDANSAEHDGPHSDELVLVDVSVVVDVERLDELSRFRLVVVERLADDVHQLVRTQHSIAVLVQRVETPSNVLVTAHPRQTQIKTTAALTPPPTPSVPDPFTLVASRLRSGL